MADLKTALDDFLKSEAFNLHADEFAADLRRELDFILEQREEAAKQNWGGNREGAGRPAKGDEVRVIRLVKHVQEEWTRYAGDMDVAMVENEVCVEAWVRGQTGATVQTRDGRAWDWKGLSMPELKTAGFRHNGNVVVYRGAKTGKVYQQMDDGSWERADEEGWTPVRGKVEIVS